MNKYEKIGEGRLYPNSYKNPGSNQPDFREKITVNNKEYSIAGWDNGPVISLNISNGIGKLFKNENASGSYPNYTGKINKGETEYRIAGWDNGSSIGLELTSNV